MPLVVINVVLNVQQAFRDPPFLAQTRNCSVEGWLPGPLACAAGTASQSNTDPAYYSSGMSAEILCNEGNYQ